MNRCSVAVLIALVLLNVSCESQTPETDALRVRAEAGDAVAQNDLGFRYASGEGVPEDEDVRWYVWHKRWADGGGSNFAQSFLPFTERTFG
jgi:hypothetical protein